MMLLVDTGIKTGELLVYENKYNGKPPKNGVLIDNPLLYNAIVNAYSPEKYVFPIRIEGITDHKLFKGTKYTVRVYSHCDKDYTPLNEFHGTFAYFLYETLLQYLKDKDVT